MEAAAGDAVVVMDADLQDPPEVVIEMAARWKEGFDVVYARRLSREGENAFKRATAHLFYRLLGAISDVRIPGDVGDFRLIDRKVVEAFRQMPEHDRFVRGMIAWLGFRQTEVAFHRLAARRWRDEISVVEDAPAGGRGRDRVLRCAAAPRDLARPVGVGVRGAVRRLCDR